MSCRELGCLSPELVYVLALSNACSCSCMLCWHRVCCSEFLCADAAFNIITAAGHDTPKLNKPYCTYLCLQHWAAVLLLGPAATLSNKATATVYSTSGQSSLHGDANPDQHRTTHPDHIQKGLIHAAVKPPPQHTSPQAVALTACAAVVAGCHRTKPAAAVAAPPQLIDRLCPP